jgi:hypothetical protein
MLACRLSPNLRRNGHEAAPPTNVMNSRLC